MASHQRWFSVRSRRMVKYAISTHQRKSNDVYWNSVPLKSGRGDSATARAAVTCQAVAAELFCHQPGYKDDRCLCQNREQP